MSERTRCNFCLLEDIRLLASRHGTAVELVENSLFIGEDEAVMPNIRRRDGLRGTEVRLNGAFVAWMWRIPDRCTCLAGLLVGPSTPLEKHMPCRVRVSGEAEWTDGEIALCSEYNLSLAVYLDHIPPGSAGFGFDRETGRITLLLLWKDDGCYHDIASNRMYDVQVKDEA